MVAKRELPEPIVQNFSEDVVSTPVDTSNPIRDVVEEAKRWADPIGGPRGSGGEWVLLSPVEPGPSPMLGPFGGNRRSHQKI